MRVRADQRDHRVEQQEEVGSRAHVIERGVRRSDRLIKQRAETGCEVSAH